MSQPLRLLFDECCSKKLAAALKRPPTPDHPGIETRHLLEYFDRGSPDQDWLAMVEREQGWVVVSKDHGRKGGGGSLPRVCEARNITHLLFTPSLAGRKTEVHLQAMLAVIAQLPDLRKLPPGTRVKLGRHHDDHGEDARYTLKVGSITLACYLERTGERE